MNADEYQQLALLTESPVRPFESRKCSRILHAMIGLCTESGELQDAMKRVLFYGKELDEANVAEEIQDCLWYAAIGLDAIGMKMSEAMEKNIAKLRVRFPDKFTEDKALNRDLDAERKALDRQEPPAPPSNPVRKQLERVATAIGIENPNGVIFFAEKLADLCISQINALQQQLKSENAGQVRHYNELRDLRAKIKAFSDSNS